MDNNCLEIVSSAYKMPFGDMTEYNKYIIKKGVMLSNECYSFEILYRAPSAKTMPVSINVRCELPIRVYRIDNLPITNAANDYDEPGYISNAPALMPDLLMPRMPVHEITGGSDGYFEVFEDNLLNAHSLYRSLWIDVNPECENLAFGSFPVEIEMIELEKNELIEKSQITLDVIGAPMCENNLIYTNWFYVDSVCRYHGVKKYSDEFFEMFEKYIKNAANHRMSALLLPMFTPALDTQIGKYRENIQLVGITKSGEDYKFDFTLAERFIKCARDCGIKIFEHCHLFTQWGAKNAPAVYDNDGKLLFGWDTDASGYEYKHFIQAYLKEFLAFAKSIGLKDDELLFHISDEPSLNHKESYKAAVDIVSDILKGYRIADALSESEFYTDSLVKTPIVGVNRADDFENAGAQFMLYYTCGTYTRFGTNRLISNTSARTRVLGLIMYRYNALGFLHWGYNYYNDRLTSGVFEPKTDPCGYKLLPGCSYLAYPTKDGVLPSMREKYMREAMDDFRRLKTLEDLIGRKAVMDICYKYFDTIDCRLIPEGDSIARLMEEINTLIGEKAVK